MNDKIKGAISPEAYDQLKEDFEKQKEEEREKRKAVKRVVEDSYYGQLIGELPKVGGRNGSKVFIRNYKGHPYIEFRKWTDTKHYSGPHRQGITLQPDQVQLLVALLEKARQTLEG